jgi:hypothetical protein
MADHVKPIFAFRQKKGHYFKARRDASDISPVFQPPRYEELFGKLI